MAKVYSITAIISLLFGGGLLFMITVETVAHIGGIIGVLSALFFGFMAYRKRLLNTGFTQFRGQYRTEMDLFQESVLMKVDIFKEIMNKNDERYTKHLDRIAELIIDGQKANIKTQKAIEKQSNVCLLLQERKSGNVKLAEEWKAKMKKELDKVQLDVAHIKKVLNHN